MRSRSARGVAALVVALLGLAGTPASASYGQVKAGTTSPTAPEAIRVNAVPEPDGTPVSLDAAIYRPDLAAGAVAPAVLLAHGFGGSRADLDTQARSLAGRGYVVATYTARGFGASGGRIHLDDPDFEVADASLLLDRLATVPGVRLDGPGDPRVGVAGGSYGGALALMLAGLDPRVDAVVAGATWNDLAVAFLPTDVAGYPISVSRLSEEAPVGVFKRRWASAFFTGALASAGQGSSGQGSAGQGSAGQGSSGQGTAAGSTPACGRFEPTLCADFLATASTGTAPERLIRRLRRNSPAVSNRPFFAPTLLVQGMNDSLFGVAQADANARQIAQAGAPVAVRWFDGGHGASPAGATMPEDSETLWPWFDTYLRADTSAATAVPVPAEASDTATPGQRPSRQVVLTRHANVADLPAMPLPPFSYVVPPTRRTDSLRAMTAPGYPGAGTPSPQSLSLPLVPREQAAALLSPPGADPAALTSLPGLGADTTGLSGITYRLAALPGQSVAFDTAPLDKDVTVVGSPRIRLSVTSSAGDATFFVSLWKVNGTTATPTRALVAPVRVGTVPGTPTVVDVLLPGGTYAMAQGSTWRVLVSATDAAFATPTQARLYQIKAADDAIVVPILPTAAPAGGTPVDTESLGVGAALLGLLALIAGGGVWLARRRRRGDRAHLRADLTEVPLRVDHLVKTYADGHRAVDDVSWEARRGQIVGLLGPNGAGKTTTIRMIVGLIRPDAGEVHVHGEPVHAGSPALGRIGALIEGPGFLPHLSGRANLAAYWAATGRDPGEAHLEEAMAVAALSDAIDRPVKAYSQGMRQRLGIAQAMLGMPEVLLLDEPTNGLDPPQIAAMRPILRDYAATGRTVVVSSHLLAEVELTCSHVVVMHRGRVILTGAVADLIDSEDATMIELAHATYSTSAHEVAEALRAPGVIEGLRSVEVDDTHGVVRLLVMADAPRTAVVAAVLAAGGDVVAVSGRRHLEEVFLGVIAADDPAHAADPDGARTVRAR